MFPSDKVVGGDSGAENKHLLQRYLFWFSNDNIQWSNLIVMPQTFTKVNRIVSISIFSHWVLETYTEANTYTNSSAAMGAELGALSCNYISLESVWKVKKKNRRCFQTKSRIMTCLVEIRIFVKEYGEKKKDILYICALFGRNRSNTSKPGGWFWIRGQVWSWFAERQCWASKSDENLKKEGRDLVCIFTQWRRINLSINLLVVDILQ